MVCLEKKNKINTLLVGASGFLGRNVYQQLKKHYNFVILLKTHKRGFGSSPQYIYDNLIELKNEKIEIIINCAVSYGGGKISNLIQSNILLPTQLLDMFEKTLKLYVTFDSFYTKFEKTPLLNYTKSKNQIREWYKCYSHLKIINLKLEHIYGKYDSNKKFIPWLIDSMLKNKTIKLSECTQKRDFIHVDEIIKLLDEIIQKRDEFSFGRTEMEVGTGKSIEIKKLVLTLLNITESNSKLIFGGENFENEIQDSYSDCKTIPDFIKWKPEINLKLGLNKTLYK
jgi:nucleoside-diphosphate-sugar epimerase